AKAQVDDSEPALVAAAAITDDDPEGVQLLLKHKARVNACDAQGRHALMTAAQEGHTAIAERLLASRADPSISDQHGTTALMEASRNGATAIVRALVNAGADLAPRD